LDQGERLAGRRLGSGVATLAVAAAALAVAGSAHGADWRITPAITVEETYTDNVFVNPNTTTSVQPAKEADFVTTVSPSLGVRATGGRIRANLDYRPSYVRPYENSDRSDFRQNLLGFGTAEIYEDIFFVDARASMFQATVSSAAPISSSVANVSSNRGDVQTFSISPTFRHHFGPYVETLTRATLDTVQSSGTNTSDTASQQVSFTASSGSYFSVLQWMLLLDEKTTERGSGRPDSTQTRLNSDYIYVLSRQWSALWSLGWEKIEDATLDPEPQGLTWSVGFVYRPTPRTELRATYGDRYDRENKNLSFSHRFPGNTTIGIDYAESIQFQQQLIGQDLSFLGVDNNGILIDTRTGLPFVFDTDSFGFRDTSFFQRRLSALLTANRGRNTFVLRLSNEERENENSALDETVRGVTGQWTHRVNPLVEANFSLSYRQTDYGAGGRTDDYISGLARVNYRLSSSAEASVSYMHSQRESSGGTAAADFEENLVTLSLRKSF